LEREINITFDEHFLNLIHIYTFFFELQLFNFISWFVEKYLVLKCWSWGLFLVYLFIYLVICLLLNWKEHKNKIKIKSKWMKIEINQIEINFTFVIWRNKRTKWKVWILFSNYKYLIKVFILDTLSKNFYGLYHYYFQLLSHCIWIWISIFESIIFEIQIKKYNEKLANINFTFF